MENEIICVPKRRFTEVNYYTDEKISGFEDLFVIDEIWNNFSKLLNEVSLTSEERKPYFILSASPGTGLLSFFKIIFNNFSNLKLLK